MIPVHLQNQNIWHRTYRLVLGLGVPTCIAGPVIMLICDLLSIRLTRNFNPLSTTISEYATGPFGWLEKIGILLVSLSFLIFSVNLFDSATKKNSRITKISSILFIVVAAGFLLVGTFKVDVTHGITSLHGFMHMFAAIAVSLIFPISCLLLSISLARQLKHKGLAGYTALMGLIGLAAVIWIALPSHRVVRMGLSERLLAGSNLTWLAFAGSGTIRINRQDNSK
jgi:hypothetical protein